jgi:hypothetical protein
MRHYDSPAALFGVPFAAIGLAGGVAAASFVGTLCSHEAGPLLVCTPAIALAVGLLVARAGRAALVPLTLAGGVLNGAAVTAFLSPYAEGVPLGAVVGLFCSLPFLLAFAYVASAAWRVGRARLGSLIDLADRRRVLRRLALVLGAASLFTFGGHHRHMMVAFGDPGWQMDRFPLVAALVTVALPLVGLCALALADGLALWRARGAVRLLPRLRPAAPQLPPAPYHRCFVDAGLGAGDATLVEVPRDQVLYRELPVPFAVVRGDPAEAARRLWRALCADAAAITLVSIVLIGHLTCR